MKVWDAESGECPEVWDIEKHIGVIEKSSSNSVISAAFSSDGKYIIVNMDNTLKIFEEMY